MPKIVQAYVATFRPTKFDSMPYEIYQPISRRFAYGAQIYVDDQRSSLAISWVRSVEPLLPQALALSGVLTAIEELDEPLELKIILRSAHLDTRITQAETRLRKKQQEKSVRPMKQEALWEDLARRLQLVTYGLREDWNEQETSELKLIEDTLKSEFYEGSRFSSPSPPDFQVIFANG